MIILLLLVYRRLRGQSSQEITEIVHAADDLEDDDDHVPEEEFEGVLEDVELL